MGAETYVTQDISVNLSAMQINTSKNIFALEPPFIKDCSDTLKRLEHRHLALLLILHDALFQRLMYLDLEASDERNLSGLATRSL